MLALLIALAAALYAVAWLLAGPPGDREVPTVPAVEVSHPAHPLGPELLAGLH